jgi:acid phosphatase
MTLTYRWLSLSLLFLVGGLATAQVPHSNHVVVVVEENHGYNSVIGNSAMPYLNSLANQYGLATQYFANTHPSIGNYFMMTAGQIITNDDGYNGTVTADNLVRHLLSGGKTWKSYAESLPYAGYTGGDSGAYLKHHNPFAYLSDVVNSDVQRMNLVPFTQFSQDLHNFALPEISFIIPNVDNDAHNGSLQQADSWLQSNIAPLLSNSAFQQDGMLIILFDEASTSDNSYGGGHVAAVVVGPKVVGGIKSSTLHQHQSMLRTISEAVGLTTFPGAAATSNDLGDLFSKSNYGVTITSPTNNSTVSSPVHFVASAKSNVPIVAMAIYVDNNLKWKQNVSSLNLYLPVTAGKHYFVVQCWDQNQVVYKTSLNITVR